ncbi:hypothetical protein HG1285_12442 [Hydrogenivirga sp. 128-5-R1-1]|nr:hypothetical protein HG1285_12442 [Hydrogenivirga sp. 128-5-R1-1]
MIQGLYAPQFIKNFKGGL